MKFEDAYSLIKDHWKDKRSERSGVLLMDHIDEGLDQARHYKDYLKTAWCLHPFIQSNDFSILLKVDEKVADILLEYRHWANNWNSKNTQYRSYPNLWPHLDLISHDVCLLLRIDKRHNFDQYCENRESYSEFDQERLDRYFSIWFKVLDVSD